MKLNHAMRYVGILVHHNMQLWVLLLVVILGTKSANDHLRLLGVWAVIIDPCDDGHLAKVRLPLSYGDRH